MFYFSIRLQIHCFLPPELQSSSDSVVIGSSFTKLSAWLVINLFAISNAELLALGFWLEIMQ
jgi:hypothetical protein